VADLPVLREKDTTSLLGAITSYLEAQGEGTLLDDLWKQQMPEGDVEGTVVALTGGPNIIGDPTRRVTFQVQVRSKKVGPGLRKAQRISNLLDDQWNVLSNYPGRIIAVSEAGVSFKDDSGNSLFPLNFVFTSTHQK